MSGECNFCGGPHAEQGCMIHGVETIGDSDIGRKCDKCGRGFQHYDEANELSVMIWCPNSTDGDGDRECFCGGCHPVSFDETSMDEEKKCPYVKA